MALTHTRTRKFVTPAGHPNSDMNVTPLVDVVLVLLIIFMVLTPLLEKNIAVRVPQTEQLTDPSTIPPDQLIVAISANGELSINNQKVPEAEYAERLERLLTNKAAADKVIFFTPDEKASYAKVVLALDGARRAGAANEESGDISVLLGNGDGTFQGAQTFWAESAPLSVVVGDFNGDGLPDLAVANLPSSHDVSVLINNTPR